MNKAVTGKLGELAAGRYLRENGYENDLNDVRLHHEIYLSDPRRVAAEKRKTVLRHPIKKA